MTMATPFKIHPWAVVTIGGAMVACREDDPDTVVTVAPDVLHAMVQEVFDRVQGNKRDGSRISPADERLIMLAVMRKATEIIEAKENADAAA